MQDGRLKGVEAVIERQEGVLAEGDDGGFLLDRQYRRMRTLRPHRCVMHKGPLAPLGDRLGVQPVPGGEFFERSLRSLYCSSDCVRGRGAAVKYLSHSPSQNAGSDKLLSLIHISEPTRRTPISYAVF